MASVQPQPNTSWLPALKAAQEKQDYTLAAELAVSDMDPLQEGAEKVTSEPTDDTKEVKPSADSPSTLLLKMVDIVEQTQKLTTSVVPLVSDPRADTWVFISPPSRQPGQDAKQYKAICEHYTRPHCFDSRVLKSLNSPAFNSWWLSPAPQQRVLRRRGLLGKLPHPIRFAIDLTPQVEGDDGAHLLSELMCPYGVRTWILAMSRWDIEDYLVGGPEDFSYYDTHEHTTTKNQDDVVGYKQPLLNGPISALGADEIKVIRRARFTYEIGSKTDATMRTQEYVIPACYTAIRHHCAIERVLNMLVDNDPKLDSAPKVWTTFVMAKHLGVANHVNLNNYIIRWLRANRNQAFIDVMPELCLEMADGLQNFDLCRQAFGILVGERALESVRAEPTGLSEGKIQRAPITVHGRTKYDISEAYETRIEYAYVGFREMVFREYTTLVEGDWIKDLPEIQRLSWFCDKNPAYRNTIRNLQHPLSGYIRSFVMYALRAKPEAITGPYGDRSENDDIFPTTRFAITWEKLSLQQRLLTRSFWTLLRSMRLQTSITNNMVSEGETWGELTARVDYHNGELDGEYPVEMSITKKELEEVLNECKQKLVSANIIHQRQAWKIGEATADNVTGSSDEDFPSSDRAEAFTEARSLYSGHPRTSADESDRHKAKRLKAEPLDGRTTEPLQGISPATLLDLPLRQRMPPKDPAPVYKSSWHQAQLAQSSQHLVPPPNGSNSFLSEPAQAPWAKAVDAENNIWRGVTSRKKGQNTTQSTIPQLLAQKSSPETSPITTANYAGSEDWWIKDRFVHNVYEDPETRFFDLEKFLCEADEHIDNLCTRMLGSEGAKPHSQDFSISDVLWCVTDDDCKFLPLWAGGNDDGSGGVFDDEIPVPDAEFTTAGPKVFSSGNSSAASSSSGFDMISRGGSTRNTSTIVLDGSSDILDRHRVYAASEVSDHPSTVGKLASELGDFDMLSDVTAEEYSGHAGMPARSEEDYEAVQPVQTEGDVGSDAGTQLSAVALGKRVADPDESFDDVFYCDSEQADTDSEGEDQVFEDD